MSEQLIEVKTIGEVEHIVHASGQWDGTEPVEFSNDGIVWAETWAPSDQHPHPQFARVTVHRKDVKVPTRKTIRWDEQYPAAAPDWAAKWDHSPMRHFGRTVRMVAFRETFRDIVGNIVIEDESDDRATSPARPVPTATHDETPRDWAAEFAAADTIEQIDALDKEARRARIFTPNPAGTALHRAMKDRRRQIIAAFECDDETHIHEPDHLEPTTAATDWPMAPKPGAPTLSDHLAPKSTATKRRRTKKRGRR